MFGKKENMGNFPGDEQKIIELMNSAIEGNFAKADESEFKNPEIAKTFNRLIASFEKSNNAVTLRLNDSMSVIGDSSCVKDMIEQVNSQSVAISDMRGASKELGETTMNIQNSIMSIQDNTHTVMDTANRIMKDMNDSAVTVDASTGEVLDINNQIEAFREKAIKITEIIDMVKKIASKSGLLALNASIEAARAGDAGRSFAVVAGQIKDLSANTTSSAETVVKYVDELMEGIDNLSSSISKTTNSLKAGNESVHHSIDYLDNMNSELVAIKKSVDDIYSEINTQTALTENFVAAIDSIGDSYDVLSRECVSTGEHLYKISRNVDKTRSDLARGGTDLSVAEWLKIFHIDHLIFTWRLYNNLAGFEDLKLEQVNNPKGCKLGKWLEANSNTKYGRLREFRLLYDAHAEIHKYAVESWHAKDCGNREEALQYFNKAYDSYLKFEKVMAAFQKAVEIVK